MRIIAGKHRGRVLAEFKGKDVRPTADRVKESLFQILSARLVGARILDLFCGSGALGLECLSRGAASVQFNDSSEESLALARKNAARLFEEGAFTRLDFRACLSRAEGKFDLILSDPPYGQDLLSEILSLVKERDLLQPNGLVVHESEREERPSAGWQTVDLRSYGRTKIYFFGRTS